LNACLAIKRERVNNVLTLVQYPGDSLRTTHLPITSVMYNHRPVPEDPIEVLSRSHALFALLVRSRNDALMHSLCQAQGLRRSRLEAALAA
jgi:hypothetical protein